MPPHVNVFSTSAHLLVLHKEDCSRVILQDDRRINTVGDFLQQHLRSQIMKLATSPLLNSRLMAPGPSGVDLFRSTDDYYSNVTRVERGSSCKIIWLKSEKQSGPVSKGRIEFL
jgi:hypothetical protein